MRGHVVLPKCQ